MDRLGAPEAGRRRSPKCTELFCGLRRPVGRIAGGDAGLSHDGLPQAEAELERAKGQAPNRRMRVASRAEYGSKEADKRQTLVTATG